MVDLGSREHGIWRMRHEDFTGGRAGWQRQTCGFRVSGGRDDADCVGALETVGVVLYQLPRWQVGVGTWEPLEYLSCWIGAEGVASWPKPMVRSGHPRR
ncbi:hypothetical protein BC938DRAFT_471000 [Jimgerdemannia flammicorona]|nr:hypothetical protein BC938DRAFT_471000 [Jimgerdemannia flammicorona]